MTQRDQVLAANRAFYAAFRAGDFATMDELWSRRRPVAVHHPDWPAIDGREAVMESWRQILFAGVPPDIHPLHPTVILTERVAMVICEEALGGARTIATNVFVLEPGGWRLTHHQATPLPVRAGRRRQGSQRR